LRNYTELVGIKFKTPSYLGAAFVFESIGTLYYIPVLIIFLRANLSTRLNVGNFIKSPLRANFWEREKSVPDVTIRAWFPTIFSNSARSS